MNSSKDSITGWLSATGTYLYILVMLIAFPVFNTEKLFNLMADKTNFFLCVTFLYACIILLSVVKAICNLAKTHSFFRHSQKRMDTIFAIVLLLAVILSTIFSLDIRKSFLGLISRNVSALCFLFCIIIYFAIRQYGVYDGLILWGWLIGSSMIYLIGIFCACGINFMHLQDGLMLSELCVFLTTLGNINSNTCYVCLMLPPIMVMFMTCKEHFSQILHGINIYLGFLFVYFIKTDSSVLTLIIGIFILGYFALENQHWSERYTQIVGIYLGVKVTIKILLYLFESNLHPFSGIHLLLLNNKVLIAEVLCYLFFMIIWKWKKNAFHKMLYAARKYMVRVTIIIVILCILCIIYANIKNTDIPEESLFNSLVIKDTTFSGRGYIWIKTSEKLFHAPLKRKLFGCGLNCFLDFMGADGGYTGGVYVDPHSEILQIATTMGLIGAVGYFGLLMETMIKALKNWKKNELQIVVAFTLSLFLIQGLVNACAIYHLPLLFIFLGLANGNMQKKEEVQR